MSLRLFIALELPAAITETLDGLIARLREQTPRGGVRWVRAEGIHLTLKFFGEVKPERVAEIQNALTQAVAGRAPLALELNGCGVFPNALAPRVAWAGLAGELTQLRALQTAVERGAAALGYPPEARGFTPHLTLGRVTEQLRPAERPHVGQALKALTFAPQPFIAERVSLIRSDLRPTGAVYTALITAPLNG
jgi:2'-5' RNA ligase